MNIYFEVQVNIFSNNRDITKWSMLLHDDDDDHNDDAKALAKPRVFSENSRAINVETALKHHTITIPAICCKGMVLLTLSQTSPCYYVVQVV